MAARLFTLGITVALLTPWTCHAQGKAKVAREAANYVMSKFGKEAAYEGIETLTRKIETLAVKHGDETFQAVRKVGPRMFHLVEEAGEHGLPSVKLLAKYGDEAIWVVAKPNRLAIFVKFGDNAVEAMIKHGEIAEPLLESMGKPAAGALKAISSQNGRRLAVLAEDGQLAKIGRTLELLDVVAKYGDLAMEFIWRHKDSLMAAPALAALLGNPEPYLESATDFTTTLAENTGNPNGQVPGRIAAEDGMRKNWTVSVVSAICVIGLLIALRRWRKHLVSSVQVKVP